MKKRWLYIPIETKVRELYGKTLLASFAAVKNFNVVIGSKKDINVRIHYLPKGTIFNVGLAKNSAKNARKYRKYGHQIVAIDEEGLVTLSDSLYIRHRVSKETLDVTDMFFCWGEKQASLVKKEADKTNCKMFITGNSRFDALREEYRMVFDKDAEEIKEKYGKFILINTNFGHGNHFAGDDFLIESFKEKGWMDDPEDKKFFLQNIEWQKRMFKEFQKTIPELSESFKGHNIIIRPHPSENHDFWKKIAKNYPNVIVAHYGNVIPWLMAADVLIHNGCTTAVEAFILGTKAVTYRPFIVAEQETDMPNKISIETHDIVELIDVVNKAINNIISNISKSKQDYLGLYLTGVNGKTASESIVYNLSANVGYASEKINHLSLFFFEIIMHIKKIVRNIIFGSDISESYQSHKIADLSENEISGIITEFSKINKEFKNIKINKIGGTCYHIYEKE